MFSSRNKKIISTFQLKKYLIWSYVIFIIIIIIIINFIIFYYYNYYKYQ